MGDTMSRVVLTPRIGIVKLVQRKAMLLPLRTDHLPAIAFLVGDQRLAGYVWSF